MLACWNNQTSRISSESWKKQVLNAEVFKQINNNNKIDTIMWYNFILHFFLLLRSDRNRKVPCWTQNIVKEEQLKFKRDTHTCMETEGQGGSPRRADLGLVNKHKCDLSLWSLAASLCPPSASHTETSELTVSQNKPSLQHQRFSLSPSLLSPLSLSSPRSRP